MAKSFKTVSLSDNLSLVKRLFFLLFSSFLLGSLVAQPSDSLMTRLNEDLSEKERAQVYIDLAWEFRDIRPDSTVYYAKKAISVSELYGFPHERIQAINFLGVGYRNLSLYSKALEQYLLALKLAEKDRNFEQRGYSLINIANLHLFQKDYIESRRYLIMALDQAQELNDLAMIGYSHINLGRVHRELQEYDLAMQYFDQAATVRKQLDDDYGLLSIKLDRAEVLRLKGSLDEALVEFRSVIKELETLQDLRGLARSYNGLSRIYLSKGDIQKAEQSALESIEIAQGLSLKYEQKESLKILAEVNAKMGLYQEAYEYLESYSNLNYQIFSEEKIRQVEQLKSQAEIERQEAENDLLREQSARQGIISYFLAIVAVLFMITAFVSYRAFIIKRKLSVEVNNQKNQIQKDKDLIEQQAAKLKELDETKSRFFSNVSHDLRTPLSLILGNLEIAMSDTDSYFSPSSKQSLESSLRNARRLVHLTDEINDITRLEEGKISLKKEPVQMIPFLKVLTDMFKSAAESKGVKLDFQSSLKSSESVQLDSSQFEKVYYNLISNAIRHCQVGDKISVNVSKYEKNILIEFSDTGTGIHPQALPNIFERYYQSHEGNRGIKEGLGIGLSLVKELVRLHDGEISVSSELGKGTTFIISLPASSNDEGVLAEISDFIRDHNESTNIPKKNSPSSIDMEDKLDPKPRILIVDDHPEIRRYIRQILEDDYEVKEASHGLEALDLLERQEVELIVTDLMMPWMDGFELIESIQANPEYKKIPMLIVSARISDDDREKALIQGINDFIQKPFDKKELELRINNLLQSNQNTDSFESVASRQNIESYGQEILKKVESYIKENIEDTNLSVLQLGDAIAASERQVYRLIKKVSGKTPYEYITDVRIQYADYLIRKNKVKSASEAARMVGIKNVTTFNKQYEKRFGNKPTELFENS